MLFRSPSPARSESPIGGYWDEFPISEFILTLYEPIQRIQWLPRAVADALEGEGPFRFLLHQVGARQGPWEVLARVIVSQEGRFAGGLSSSPAGKPLPGFSAWRLPSSSVSS